jgi:hypothetical protein
VKERKGEREREKESEREKEREKGKERGKEPQWNISSQTNNKKEQLLKLKKFIRAHNSCGSRPKEPFPFCQDLCGQPHQLQQQQLLLPPGLKLLYLQSLHIFKA